MKSQLEWIQERYPHIKGLPVADSLAVDYLLYAVKELSAELAALKPYAPAGRAPALGDKAEDQVIKWPDSPKVCKCGNFEENFEGDTFTCIHCGGGRF